MSDPSPPALVPERLVLAGVELDVLRPRDPDALLSEEAFAHEEFLPYWAELWPSAPVLAELLRERVAAGDRVLELGCGLGLPALVAARLGATATATDWAPDALELLSRNATRNGTVLDVLRLDWFRIDEERAAAELRTPWPLVIAADVLYESRNGAALLATLDAVVAPGGEAWIADPGRRAAGAFWAAAEERWEVDVLGDPAPGTPVVRRLRRRADG